MRLVRTIAVVGSVVLWLLVAAGAAAGTAVLLGALGVVRPLAVISDSMAPAFGTGDLLVAVPVATASLGPGDIVVAPNPRPGAPDVSHRVESIGAAADGGWIAVLKGDANGTADPAPYRLGDLSWRVVLGLPGVAARYADLIRPQVGVPILVGLAALAAGAVVATPATSTRRPRHRRSRGRPMPPGPRRASTTGIPE